jgi:Asp/Glu/hydantoin racemase
MISRRATGGKTVYGARVGILMLDTRWPRIPGDTGHAATWPFPVLYKVVKGATARVVINEKGRGLGQAFLDAAAELVKEGADGITTTGGFLSVFQNELSAHAGVPVASSSLMQIPLVQSLLPPGKRVGVLTVQGERLGPDHLVAIGAPADTPIVGTEKGRELTRVIIGDENSMDYALAEQDMIDAAQELLTKHDNIGALVLECHNMAPYSWRLQNQFGIPVYDVYTLVTWFHSGLQPRNFGYPGSSVPEYGWRERL